RWERFWGVLHATQFELYDFEYKGNRPPLYVIPLDQFVNVSSIEEDEDDHLADIGSRGLVLEFTSKALDKEERRLFSERESGCRMFLLPESTASAREWKDKLNYAASVFEELGGELDSDDSDSLYSFDDLESDHRRMLTVIDSPNSSLRFLILDCPTESTLDFYMEEFMRLNVVAVARCCQPTYSANRLNERDIQVMDLPFKDGGV
ncbi:Protein tyrosine phosphatase type IVA 1, partial [Rhizopus stolonifer]